MQIEDFFQTVNDTNIAELVPQFYREDIQFRDPLVALQGREALIVYYQKLFAGVDAVQIVFGEHLETGDSHMIAWTLTLRAGRLNNGNPFHLDGISHIKYAGGLVYYHREYFDLSVVLFEKLPVIGGLMGWLKKQNRPDLSWQTV
ncbi:nuclear transport factor 2 family protein [Oligoflexus tunisiensis]|uniref:nuclear transport factor 2 family protein n=1 Tax=Oligoflexus tunisiensis TaxID=708132 RepID=UPI00114CC683|nr:nuclear transport factor 2 family protein [Oligoflexus tunisiensis]